MELPVLPTTVIGSYPRPKWLRKMVKAYKRGKLTEAEMKEAFDDAVRVVLLDQERAGVDIPSDGEMRRDEMVEYFAERIGGFKFYGPVRVWGNHYFNKPAVVSKLEYRGPMVVDEFLFLKEHSTRPIVKVTITGPYTIADWSFNEYYESKEELASELAKIINKEILELQKAGAMYIQVDEPALTTHPDEMDWAVQTINEVTKGVNIKLGIHVCYANYELLAKYFDELKFSQFALEFANRGFRDIEVVKGLTKELGFGVIDVHNRRIESPEEVAKAIRKIMKIIEPEMLYINPDCGLKLLPREIAREKLEVMVKGVEIVRKELRAKGLEKIPFRTKV